ncbi:MAG TPA: hypothetical protein VNK04_08945 [Gemmataceae bacterium]|nr:hypothetical protein [Gemmataceae bacterium]
MPVKLRTKRPDKVLKQIVGALEEYAATHPKADIETYRPFPAAVRIRVIDPGFKGVRRSKREDELWAYLEKLPEEVVSEITLVLMYTPAEAKKSFANKEFENSIPSRI